MTSEQLSELEALLERPDRIVRGALSRPENELVLLALTSLQHRVSELENALRDLVPTAYFGEPAMSVEFYAKARKLLA